MLFYAAGALLLVLGTACVQLADRETKFWPRMIAGVLLYVMGCVVGVYLIF